MKNKDLVLFKKIQIWFLFWKI